MAPESSMVEQAVARALRDNLERIQRTGDELHQAINDMVAACSSSKPTNALPPMLRAQAAAASLSAALDVLSRFTALSLQTGPRSPLEERITEAIGQVATEPPPVLVRPAPSIPEPRATGPEPRAVASEPVPAPPARPPIPRPSVETDLYAPQ